MSLSQLYLPRPDNLPAVPMIERVALSKTLITNNRPGYGNRLFGTSWTRKECPAKPGGVGCRSRPAARAAFSAVSHAGPRVPHPTCAWLPTSLSPPSSVVGTAREVPDHPALQAPGTSPFDTASWLPPSSSGVLWLGSSFLLLAPPGKSDDWPQNRSLRRPIAARRARGCLPTLLAVPSR